MGWGQASLPLTRTAWGATPIGWTDNGTQRTTPYACSGSDGGSLQGNGKSYKVWFTGTPNQLTYSLKGSNPTNGNFRVQESSDGSTWTDVSVYATISGASCIVETKTLLSTTRYVQFIYVTKTTGNVDIDDVSITAGTACATPNPTGTITATQNCGNTSLTYSAPSASLYWQTSATGTSTANATTAPYTVSSNGTYYVRAFNGTCWSTGTVSQAVTVVNPITISSQPTSQSATTGNTATFSVTASNAAGYQW